MSEGIETRLIYGFLGAGKTHYIHDSIQNDYFHKYGVTLILSFEQGEEEYAEEMLTQKRTFVACYEGGASVSSFCERSIEAFRPDRIYVEMNTMIQGLREQFPECMRITFAVTLIDWVTMPVYFVNFKQMIKEMTAASQQVIFRGCPSKELLAPYSQPFRLMNQKVSYLRQDPMGYHEKAFDLFLPFSLDGEEITITEERYLPFWLDALDHPEHYEGKRIHFADPLELRQDESDGTWRAGRVVMVCCMADLQFMSFALDDDSKVSEDGWVTFDALGLTGTGAYGRRFLKLKTEHICRTAAPENLILDSISRK